MKDVEIRKVVDGLLEAKGKVWKINEIEEYLKNFEISSSNMVEILELLSDDYIFKWLDFISLKLPDLVNEDDFVNLLKKIISRIKGDWAQGPFVHSLVKIGEKDTNLGSSLYEQMISEKDNNLIFYSSFVLGGIGRGNFEEAHSLIKKGLEDKYPHNRAACIKALSVVFENETELKASSQIFKILDKFSTTKEHIIVQIEVLHAFLDFARFRPDYCFQHTIEFARRDDSTIRFNLVNRLTFRNIFKIDREIEILRVCADDKNKNVLSRVALALSRKGQTLPEKTLRIIKDWISKGRYFDVYEVEYTIKEIGKANQERSLREVEKWIKESINNHRLQFLIPRMLERLSSSNYMQLIEFIKPWLSLGDVYRDAAKSTIKAVLTEIYPPQAESMEIVDSCFAILAEKVKEKNVEVKKIIKGETDKLFQCFLLIKELETEREELDFKIIFKNLGKYPAIRDFFGDNWFNKMNKERDKVHPLLICLSKQSPDQEMLSAEVKAFNEEADGSKRYLRSLRIENILRSSALLEYWEEMLCLIVSKSKKLKDLKDGLRNEDQFWETISEVEVISSFFEDYIVEIAPKLNEKKLDVKVELNEISLLVEVINPKRFKPLQYLTGKTIGIKNRARDKIFDEFKSHFKGMPIENSPIVIIINIARSEINYSSIEEYLVGTPQLTMLFDKERAEVVKSFPSRAKNSMHLLEEKTDILSAVIPYKVFLGKDRKFHREGSVMLNPHAKNPLNLDTVRKIEKIFFR